MDFNSYSQAKWLPEGTGFFTNGSDGYVQLWDAAQGNLIDRQDASMQLLCCALSPGVGRFLAFAGGSNPKDSEFSQKYPDSEFRVGVVDRAGPTPVVAPGKL